MISSVSVVSRQMRPGVDPRELLEEHRLALHHRHRRPWADVAQAEHGRPVGHDGDRVLLDREGPDLVGLGGDRQADPGDARRVRHREVVARLHRDLVLHLDLAAQVHEERAVGDVHDGDAGHVADGVDDPLAVVGVRRRDRHVAHAALARDPHEVDRAEVAVGLADRCGDLRERPRHRRELDADREAVRRGRVGGRHLAAKPIAGPTIPSDTLLTVATVKQLQPKDLNLDDAPAKQCDVFLVDGNGLAYRAFYALPEELQTVEGLPTNALLGLANMFMRMLMDYRPRTVLVAWDSKPTGRLEIAADYKAHRKPMPDLLRQQQPWFEPVVEAFGYRNLKVEGKEADDVIGTLSRMAEEAGHKVCVVSTDRDAFQLASDSVCIMMTPRGVAGRRRLHARADHPALRDRPRGDPRLHRPQGRHVRQHRRRPRHRRQDGRRAARPVREHGGRLRQPRRRLGREAAPEPRGGRRRPRPTRSSSRPSTARSRSTSTSTRSSSSRPTARR